MAKKSFLLSLFLVVGALNLGWFLTGDRLTSEAPMRTAVGALFLFLVPGLIWGEVCRFRARHPWETIALAFSITLLIDLLLLPIVFALHVSIEAWLTLL